MTDTAPPPDAASSALPRHTTPTWEVELLISGVAVFAMLQLPGWLDDRYFEWLPRLDGSWSQPLFLLYVYLKSAALILAATFALHLLLRAQWIARVGMHSVYPDGIRWERLRMGPVQHETESGSYEGSDAAIERADNRATVVFSIGVMLASGLLLISAVVICLFAVIAALSAMLDIRVDLGLVLFYAITLGIAPAVLARFIDLRFGERFSRNGIPRRCLAAIFSFYSRLGVMSRSSNPTFSLLSSHGGEYRAVVITTTIMLLAGAAVYVSRDSQQNPADFGSYSAFPVFADGTRTVDGAHYDDQRNPTRDPAVPYIESAVVKGPYLSLVVPYEPEHDGPALRRHCPASLALHDDAPRATAVLDCLQRLHAVSLDGRPLAAAQYELGSDARTDRPALLAMIDVRDLPPGRHELRIARPVPPASGNKARQFDTWRIPFWR